MSIDIKRWANDPAYRAAHEGPVCRGCGWPDAECICMAGPSHPKPPPLLPDDDTAVERLAPIVHQVFCVEVMEETHQMVGPWDEGRAAAIIERLREGGQPK